MSAQIRAESVLNPSNIRIIDGTARMHDLDLARVLEFSELRFIRRLITSHKNTLIKFDTLFCAAAAQNKKRGRPAQEYWLTKKQCLYLCTKSETANATEITIRMVEVFNEATNGRPSLAAGNPNLTPKQRANKLAYWQSRAFECEQQLRALGAVGYQSPVITQEALSTAVKGELSNLLGVSK